MKFQVLDGIERRRESRSCTWNLCWSYRWRSGGRSRRITYSKRYSIIAFNSVNDFLLPVGIGDGRCDGRIGACEGDMVGHCEGENVGLLRGIAVGRREGLGTGCLVGFGVGFFVGSGVGWGVGRLVGIDVGRLVGGLEDGRLDGTGVGLLVGLEVGRGVG